MSSREYHRRRRQIRKNVQNHLNFVFHVDDSDSCNAPVSQIVTEDESTELPVSSSELFESPRELNASVLSEEQPTNKLVASVPVTRLHSGPEECLKSAEWKQFLEEIDAIEKPAFFDCSDEETDEQPSTSNTLLTQLDTWASEHRLSLSRSCLSDLLCILRVCHPSLPEDPRTLLDTPRIT
jgi:hypothetical protein